MYCPKCGQPLSEPSGGIFVCEPGKMELTPDLSRRLKECYIDKIRAPNETLFNFVVGGKWFCPECGVQTLEQEGNIQCPDCGRRLNEFIFALIEHCPHLGEF